MPYFDVQTGETYDQVLWADEHVVMFWTAGRESTISAAEWAADVTLAFEVDAPRPFTVARFQGLAPFDDEPPVAVQGRRAWLTAYAASNGGLVNVHQGSAPAARPAGLFGFRWPNAAGDHL